MRVRDQKIDSYLESLLYLQKLLGTSRDCFLKKHGLNKAQVTLLHYIAHTGRITTRDLSKEIGITSGAVTQIVDGLVKENYLERTMSQEDRRMLWISFTEEGKAKYEQFKKQQLTRIAEFLEGLTDEELELLLKIQQKAIEKSKSWHAEQHKNL